MASLKYSNKYESNIKFINILIFKMINNNNKNKNYLKKYRNTKSYLKTNLYRNPFRITSLGLIFELDCNLYHNYII